MATTAAKRRMRWYQKVLLPVISVGVFVGVCESICRGLKLAPPKRPPFKFVVRHAANDVDYPFMVEDPVLLWAPKPGFQGEEKYYGTDVQISSSGFRDREYSLAKPPKVFRILCLGDSTTFGFGVAVDATYHSLLEEMLNLVGDPSGPRYEVINGGVTGYSSSQCLLMYQHRGRKLRPDMVLLNAGPNDLSERRGWSDDELLSGGGLNVLRTVNDGLSSLHCYRALQRLLCGPREYGADDDPGTVPRVGLEAYKKNLAALDECCGTDGCRLVLISFAYCRQIRPDQYAESSEHRDFARRDARVLSYRQALETVAHDRRIPLVTLSWLTEKSTTPSRDLFLDPFHLNRAGHLLLAITLWRFLYDHGLLPEDDTSSTGPSESLRVDMIREFVKDRGYLAEEGQPVPGPPVGAFLPPSRPRGKQLERAP